MRRLLLAAALLTLACGGGAPAGRTDTVRLPGRVDTLPGRVDTLPGRVVQLPGRVDTVTQPAPPPVQLPGRVDTLRTPSPPPVQLPGRVDTVRVAGGRDTVMLAWQPNTNAARDSVLWFGPYPWPGGSRPENFALPRAPGRVDTVSVPTPVVVPPPVPPPVVVVPPPPAAADPSLTIVQETPTLLGVFRGAERIGQVAPTGNISVTPWTHWAAWRKTGPGTICVNDTDYPTQEAAITGVTAPYAGRDLCAPTAHPPELPRATVDTQMPPAPAP